jgi:hypothetical protein
MRVLVFVYHNLAGLPETATTMPEPAHILELLVGSNCLDPATRTGRPEYCIYVRLRQSNRHPF